MHHGSVWVILTFLTLLIQSSHVQRFSDMYECHIIVDVEVAKVDSDEFEQIDCDDFMAAVRCAKKVGVAFNTDVVAHLMDDEGIRYRMNISKSRLYVAVGSDVFRLRAADRRRMQHLLTGF